MDDTLELVYEKKTKQRMNRRCIAVIIAIIVAFFIGFLIGYVAVKDKHSKENVCGDKEHDRKENKGHDRVNDTERDSKVNEERDRVNDTEHDSKVNEEHDRKAKFKKRHEQLMNHHKDFQTSISEEQLENTLR